MFYACQMNRAFCHVRSCTAHSARKPYANLMDAAFMVASLFLIICLLAVYVSIRLWLPIVPVVWFICFIQRQESRLPPL